MILYIIIITFQGATRGRNEKCSLCDLSEQFGNEDNTKWEDPIEKALRIADVEFVPWGEEPVKCNDLTSGELWGKFQKIVDLDWRPEQSSLATLIWQPNLKVDDGDSVHILARLASSKAENDVRDAIR